jgi:hypothetical protein
MQAQLSVFDGQLAVREEILAPLAGWSKAWAGFEGLVVNARRDPGPAGWREPGAIAYFLPAMARSTVW